MKDRLEQIMHEITFEEIKNCSIRYYKVMKAMKEKLYN